jgi:phage baseplate assembly protein W
MADVTGILGFGFPLRVNAQGGIAETTGADAIRQAVLTILGTQPGERLMRPDYGCPLRSLVFAPNNAATASLARFYVQNALTRWEPRIVLDEVLVQPNQQGGPLLIITVSYHLRASGQAQSLGFQVPLA